LHPDLKLNGLNEKYLLKKMMKNRLPDSILNRSKQAYRAPIKSTFISKNLPDYLSKMLSEDNIKSSGIFNSKYVKLLLAKMHSKKQVSEIDNMALTGILSTQILYDLFVKRNIEELGSEDLVKLDKIIVDN